ncbi:hypothetical protein BDD12DRAFT_865070 [Trichophaea hybrida]|nr:hypothetical protein BDD12DRAFT_865070 [Trichophaea hybrida]
MSELLTFILQHHLFSEARLPSLYSDFRYLKTTNPSAFHANVKAWKTVLADACKAGKVADGSDRLILCIGEDLMSMLYSSDWGRPLALGVVVAEAVDCKSLYPLKQFLSQRESIYHWSYAGVAFNWGLEKIGVKGMTTGGNREIAYGQFVVVKNIEDVALSIIRSISASTRSCLADRIFTPALFASEFAPTLSSTDLEVLLCHLWRDRRECTFDGKTIKLKSPNEQLLMPITEQDTTIADLKYLLRSVQIRIDSLGANIKKYTENAQIAVINQNRGNALAALKSRNVAESILAHQFKALGQIEDVLASIQTAANNMELIQILQKSSAVLSELNKDIGGTETVDRIILCLREETQTLDGVNQILYDGGPVIAEDVIEDELHRLMKVVKCESDFNESLESAPRIAEADRQLSNPLQRTTLEAENRENERQEVHA